MRQEIKILLLLILWITIVIHASSQSVGLVLSGGGAKGLAHIGVIRALEENNIPIDYVAGTSIGAIVGGLYAVGLSPDEMEDIFRDDKFFNYYKGRIPEDQFYYFKKTKHDASAFRLGFTKADSGIGVVLPTNIVATQPMDFGIMEYFSQYTAASNRDFDKLFVPFRCVGADVYESCEVVFKSGDLGQSIRASMTFPFYFKPVMIDSVLLFDGGIFNNFPIDVMRNEFNPDIMIGVSVTSYSEKPDPDNLMLQIENLIMGAKKEYQVPDSEGVTLTIEFKDVGLLDFHRLDEFSQLGYNECMLIMDSVKSRIHRRVSLPELRARREIFKMRVPLLKFDKFSVNGIDEKSEDYILKSLKGKTEKLNLRQFESEYYKLISDYQIESATPFATYNDTTGFFDVVLDIKKQKRANVLFGAGLSTGYSNTGFVGFNYKILNRMSFLLNTNAYFGRLYSSFHLSGRFDFPFRIPLAMDIAANVSRFDFFKGNSRLFSLDYRPPYLINSDNNTRFDVFTPLTRMSIIKLGYARAQQSYDYFQINNFLQTDTADLTSFSLNTVYLSFIRDNHNYFDYANKGARNLISLRYVSGVEYNKPGSTTAMFEDYEVEHSWLQFNVLSDTYSQLSKGFTIGVYAELMMTTKSLFRNYTSSVLSAPSFSPTPHSRTLFLPNYHANSYAAFGLKPIFLLSDKFNIRLEAYAFLPFEKILKESPYNQVYLPYYSESFSYIHFLGATGLVYHSPLGPLAFTVNYYQTDSRSTYFMLHFGYVIFNKKSFDY
ncbi:MAG: patatin-like phospholipase family protein [Bacteroidales bacterium]|nr:patatin-like phospholipase family protein [Bacteroidales bacterium]